ncbi:MAG: SDR family NAD(P)-dependent oxidoreductase [Candidatus Hydrogenedentes bacterium]|nr:SDR family NAD(P)-dependent oxidoreductase [Candidatus Hydrogenedentota bacterium]
MAARFSGKAVFITGASSGIGAALAKRFAAEGARVALAARRTGLLRKVQREIAAEGGDAIAVTCDVTSPVSIKRAVARVVKTYRRLDVVVANAGMPVNGRFTTLDTADFRRQFDTNFFGVVDTIYATLPHLRKTRGRLAIVTSIAGRLPLPGGSAYCASKFAACGLAECLYHEFSEFGVSVTNVLPGFVNTEIGYVKRNGSIDRAKPNTIPEWLAAGADQAAAEMLDAIHARKAEVVLTAHGKLIEAVGRYFPRLTRLGQRLAAKEVMHILERGAR